MLISYYKYLYIVLHNKLATCSINFYTYIEYKINFFHLFFDFQGFFCKEKHN